MKGMDMKMGYVVPDSLVIGDNMKTGGNPKFNYDYLRAPHKTTLDESETYARDAF